MELVLGVVLGIGIIYLKPSDSKKSASCAVHRAFGVFADAALLLTFSVQLASVVILIKKDFGISAKDFGGLTVEVTWAAALLTMLPMRNPSGDTIRLCHSMDHMARILLAFAQ